MLPFLACGLIAVLSLAVTVESRYLMYLTGQVVINMNTNVLLSAAGNTMSFQNSRWCRRLLMSLWHS